MKTPFTPDTLPFNGIDWQNLIELIIKANSTLARYDGRLESIPNPELLLSPLLTQEAVLSSRIEGTQATLEEVLEFEADPRKPSKRYDDIEEILNYRKSLYLAKDELQDRPLCLNLIKSIHQSLLRGVRGQYKSRGEFRETQNWIGKPNTPMEEATYVPPPPDCLLKHLSNWEKYCHYDEKDRLVQLAIVHAQFEIIHPFLDGNGRIGRILIPIFLFEKKVLSSPTFYISAYFEANRDEYYARLLAISEQGDWTGWIKFFLRAIIEQAAKNSQKAQDIMSLYNEMKEKIANLTHSRFAIQTMDFLFHRPIFTSSLFVTDSQITKASVNRILKSLHKGDVIDTITEARGRTAALYVFPELLAIIQK